MPRPRALGKVQRGVEIFQILYRNDFLGVLRDLARAERVLGPKGKARVIPEDVPPKVRRMLEELGPTFIKVGQLLGTRPDILPKPFVEEFRRLYDRTPPTPFPLVRKLLERELGSPLEEVFLEFEETPVASASIGQVHFARLRSGEPVAVKCQHPDIEERVFVDFEIMAPLARFVENLFSASRVFQPREHLQEIFEMLVRELDYRHEARNHERVFRNFQGFPGVRIPRIHWEYTTKRVLVLERVEGVKLSELDEKVRKSLDGRELARTITLAMAKMIFEDRVFHADPSPGNLVAVDSKTVAFLDFGAVGRVSRRRAERILRLILGFLRDDPQGVAQSLFEICTVRGEVDLEVLSRDVERVMERLEGEGASVLEPEILDPILEIAQKHNMLLPPDFILITRALFQFEGVCRRLDPSFRLSDVLEPYVRDLARRKTFQALGSGEGVIDMAFETASLARTLPSRLGAIARRLERGEFRVRWENVGSEESTLREERRNFRLAFTVVVGALLVGSALVVSSSGWGGLLPYFFVALVLLLFWSFVMLYLSE